MIFNIRHTHRADRGSMEEKKRVLKKFDTPISKIGELQAYRIGERIAEEIGRNKEFVFISSPYQRCLQTVELITSGMTQNYIKIYQNKIFVEDAIRETQKTECVQSIDNFDKIAYFEKPIIDLPHVYNQFPGLEKYRTKEEFNFDESFEDQRKRVAYATEQIQKWAENNLDKIVIFVSHGFFPEVYRYEKTEEWIQVLHYGAVNKFVYDESEKKWDLTEIDAKYY